MRLAASLGEAWLVLVMSLVFGALLAAVQAGWGARIDQNKENDARGRVPLLVHGADGALTPPGEDLEVKDERGTRLYRLYRAMSKTRRGERKGAADPEQIGWVVKAKGPGYADTIEVLIGLDLAAERLTGLDVLAQNETPCLGNKIREEPWRAQFRDKALGAVLSATKSAVASANEIKAISGATISSQSVCDIVNQATADFASKLPGLRRRKD
jgi:electron transport complex protein RnfG